MSTELTEPQRKLLGLLVRRYLTEDRKPPHLRGKVPIDEVEPLLSKRACVVSRLANALKDRGLISYDRMWMQARTAGINRIVSVGCIVDRTVACGLPIGSSIQAEGGTTPLIKVGRSDWCRVDGGPFTHRPDGGRKVFSEQLMETVHAIGSPGTADWKVLRMGWESA